MKYITNIGTRQDLLIACLNPQKALRWMPVCLILLLGTISAQAQQVRASVDTTSIRIGEQINYLLEVETQPEDLIEFPSEETFEPMEVVEIFPTDTLRPSTEYSLRKKYSLTHFDSGSYTIPRQLVRINDEPFYTDSLLIEVADVVVDTTKQKLYPIKPYIEPSGGFRFPAWGWWILIILLLAVGGYFIFQRRKKKKEAASKLPPYEQALSDLEELDKSQLLDNREIKEYYSRLTYAIRRYLDEEVYPHAMESTSAELLLQVEAERKAGRLLVEEETIRKLREILTRADLAKFANQRPDLITAREDRARAAGVIDETKQGIPQPTEEELRQTQEYQEKVKQRKTRKKIVATVVGVLVGIVTFFAVQIAFNGWETVRDTYFGHPTKVLLEEDWITSEYGTPPVRISTPRVLKRGEMPLPDQVRQMMVGNETFLMGELEDSYFIAVTTLRLRGQSNFDLEVVVDGIYGVLEDQGASMILMKQEEVTSRDGSVGMKVFGSFIFQEDESGRQYEKEYEILNFAENGGYQQIMLIYDREDTYAQEITERILSSVELNFREN